VCARVGNQWSCGVVTARIRTDVVRSLHHQRRDLHQSTYPYLSEDRGDSSYYQRRREGKLPKGGAGSLSSGGAVSGRRQGGLVRYGAHHMAVGGPRLARRGGIWPCGRCEIAER
jgi:hypothetical protein